MNGLVLATAPAVMVVLVACVTLLSVRAWRGIAHLVLTRRVSLLLDGAILLLGVLFLVLVIVRFRTNA